MPSSKTFRALFAAASVSAGLVAPALAQDQSGSVGVLAPTPKTGKETYEVICQACHMADGKGGTGAGTIPALAGNTHLAAPSYPIEVVLDGRGAMPWFKDTMTPAQVADVVRYIRTSFGNRYTGAVTEAAVKELMEP